MPEIHVREAQYVDPRAGHDKFFRTFSSGPLWLTQYGANGSTGTFTKVMAAASPEAAARAAAKKLGTKLKKGYRAHRDTIAVVDREIPSDGTDLTWLDAVAAELPLIGAAALASAPSASDCEPQPVAVDLSGLTALEDMTSTVSTALRAHRAGEPVSDPAAEQLPLRPMLAAPVDAARYHDLAADDQWVAQYKYDGDRVLIVVDEGSITVLNRAGEAKKRGVSAALLQPFTALHRGRWVFDGEVVGRTVVLFDMVVAQDPATAWLTPESPFEQRYAVLGLVLEHILPTAPDLHDDGISHVLAPVFRGTAAKTGALAAAVAQHREGLVLRELDAPYEQARRSMSLLKHKFTRTADLVVTTKHAAKDSVELAVSTDGGLRIIGSASNIGRGAEPGQVWEVEYLYIVDPEHPRMVQPRLLRLRDDKAPAECSIDQFADSWTDRSV